MRTEIGRPNSSMSPKQASMGLHTDGNAGMVLT